MQKTEGLGLTPVQFAALQSVANTPGIQRTHTRSISLDTWTTGGMVDRLEALGLLQRNTSPNDRRVRLLTITDAGRAMLDEAKSPLLHAQQRMLEPVPAAQREGFMRMLRTLFVADSALSRTPGKV